jgi:leucyl/phenylalanyl-tRNA--protein transferase
VRRLPYVLDLHKDPVFPDDLSPDEHGLVAMGGELSERVLLEAYSKGIFPWFNAPPLMWFSPDPRTVLFPERFHVPHRLARQLRQGRFEVRFDRDFEQIMLGCATVPRQHEEGTWIDHSFLAAYTRLHRLHIAHCVGVYLDDALCGGLYGVSLGGIFFGESMFSLVPNTSKIALAHLVGWVRWQGYLLIDCQARTEHLIRLGAEEIPRSRFLELLAEGLKRPDHRYPWTNSADLPGSPSPGELPGPSEPIR